MENARSGDKKTISVGLLRNTATRRHRIDNCCEGGVSALVRPIVLAYKKNKNGVLSFPFCEDDENLGIFVAYGVAELVFKSMERMVEAWIRPYGEQKSLRDYREDLSIQLSALNSDREYLERLISNKVEAENDKVHIAQYHLTLLNYKIEGIESQINFLKGVEERSKCFSSTDSRLTPRDVRTELKRGFRTNYEGLNYVSIDEGLNCVSLDKFFGDFPDYATDYVSFLIKRFKSLGLHGLHCITIRLYADEIRDKLSTSDKHMHEIYNEMILKCAQKLNILGCEKKNAQAEMTSALKMALKQDKEISSGGYRPEQLYSGSLNPVTMAAKIYANRDK